MAVVPRGNRYYVVVLDGKLPSGRPRQRWLSGYATRAEAEAADHELKAARLKGTLALPSTERFEVYLTAYIARLEVRDRTRLDYEGLAGRYLVPALGHLALGSIRPRDVEALMDQLRGLGLAPNTRLHAYRLLSQAMTAAVKTERIPRNPCVGVKPPSAEDREAPIPTPRQLVDLLAAFGRHRWGPLYLTAFWCGARKSELLGLQWSDVQPAALVVVRGRQRAGGRELVDRPKSRRGRRLVALPAPAQAIIAALPRSALWVFPYDPDAVSRDFKAMATPILPGLVLHDLRHLHASFLLRYGADLAAVSQRLGHNSMSTTDTIYRHHVPGNEAALAALFERSIAAYTAVGSGGD